MPYGDRRLWYYDWAVEVLTTDCETGATISRAADSARSVTLHRAEKVSMAESAQLRSRSYSKDAIHRPFTGLIILNDVGLLGEAVAGLDIYQIEVA